MSRQTRDLGDWVVAKVVIGELDDTGAPLIYARPGDLGQVIGFSEECEDLVNVQWPGGIYGCVSGEYIAAFQPTNMRA